MSADSTEEPPEVAGTLACPKPAPTPVVKRQTLGGRLKSELIDCFI